jgi:hypothetical protein
MAFGLLFLLEVLPGRVRLLPTWFPYALGLVVLVPVAGVWLSGANALWLKIEEIATLSFAVIAETVTFTSLLYLIGGMVKRPEDFNGIQLFMSSISAWASNVMAFSLLYWRIDRGGPEARLNNAASRPDWLFPQTGVPDEAPLNWSPTYVDYLFLSFNTATAFSPTDTLPLTSRAKLLTMFESSVALCILIVIAARAINLIGS